MHPMGQGLVVKYLWDGAFLEHTSQGVFQVEQWPKW